MYYKIKFHSIQFMFASVPVFLLEHLTNLKSVHYKKMIKKILKHFVLCFHCLKIAIITEEFSYAVALPPSIT